MVKRVRQDRSNGYEDVAEQFMTVRNPTIGAATVSEWSKALPRGASVLDIGCGHGVPISQVLIDDGFVVYGVDASATLIAAFRQRFPNVHAECAAVEESDFFGRMFDGVVAWGVMFLLPAHAQSLLISKVAGALRPGGQFLFTSGQPAGTWPDALTGRESISLGYQTYQRILAAEGLTLVGERWDEGDNYYYLVSKPRAET